MITSVLFDFGGVVLSSPFDAFNQFEEANGFPRDFIRSINSRNPDDNAWAKFERRDVDAEEFDELFASESEAAGHRVGGAAILELIHGKLRPEMVEAIGFVKAAGLKTACLTNNFRPSSESSGDVLEVMQMFNEVVESSKVGIRKPEVRFYEIALEMLGIEAAEAVFLDDLGINLKPARAMGMTTIKVLSAEQAITDLEAVLGIPLRSQP